MDLEVPIVAFAMTSAFEASKEKSKLDFVTGLLPTEKVIPATSWSAAFVEVKYGNNSIVRVTGILVSINGLLDEVLSKRTLADSSMIKPPLVKSLFRPRANESMLEGSWSATLVTGYTKVSSEMMLEVLVVVSCVLLDVFEGAWKLDLPKAL